VQTLPYNLSRFLCRAILEMVGKVLFLRRERSAIAGPCILVSNHISHFDPMLVTAAAVRHVDWMAMGELFENRWLGHYFRSVGTFPTDRFRVDRKSVKTALERLRAGRVIGIFPEGGIRAGATSILGGAPMRPGAATLAEMARVPVLPCVVVGTDRLYAHRSWWPLRQLRFWIGFGEPISPPMDLPRQDARDYLERRLAEALRSLFAEMQEHFNLTEDDLPQNPARRKGRE
jgi:1-acyl-sn-glycerol-3-phosphate acyltransferase